MAYCSIPATTLNPSPFLLQINKNSTPRFLKKFHSTLKLCSRLHKISGNERLHKSLLAPNSIQQETESEYETEQEEEEEYNTSSSEEYEDKLAPNGQSPPPVLHRRRRYRKKCPGEDKGITEEMRFVAMKLRNSGKGRNKKNFEENEDDLEVKEEEEEDKNGDTWQPSVEGFLKYMVDSELVFSTVERIVDESSDVSYVYFRKTGLERSECFSRDLEWFREQGHVIPEPSSPGVTYAQYLKELAEKSPPLFLCHFYNIYFSHIAGGQVIAKQVSKKLLEGRELEFYRWEGDAEDLLRGVRQNLNALGEVQNIFNIFISHINAFIVFCLTVLS
ncbi:hypothetical protein RD792_001035, partial [Penstemon davidsonii]